MNLKDKEKLNALNEVRILASTVCVGFIFHDLGGRSTLASIGPAPAEIITYYVIDLETGECSVLLENANRAHFLPDGFMAFTRDQSLWVVPFDPDTARVTGPPKGYLSGVGGVSLDRSGDRAVYTTRDKSRERSEIVVVDEADRVLETLLTAPGQFLDGAALSPDGRRLAYLYRHDDGRGLWVLDISSGLTRQVSPKGDFAFGLQWLPDGRLAYSTLQGGGSNDLMVIDAVPGATPRPLLPHAGGEPFKGELTGVSPDGRHVLAEFNPPDERVPGIYLFDVGDGDSGRAFYASERAEGRASFRPDGKWVVYATNGTGRFEVYLRPFVVDNPESAPIYPVTRLGGNNPMWSRDGRTLYYQGVGAENDRAFAVTVETEPELRISERRLVFDSLDGVNWVVPMPGGRLIKLQDKSQGVGDLPNMRVILNWGLSKLVAAQQ